MKVHVINFARELFMEMISGVLECNFFIQGMVGSDVYLCYKKSQGTSKRIAYKPAVLDHFPLDDKFTLAQNIPMFCLPMGALVECWPARCQPPEKSFSTFVLTDQVFF